MKIVLIVLIFLVSCLASTYVECKAYRTTDNKLYKFNLKLDEESSKITFSSDTTSYIDNGYFASDVIRFSSTKDMESASMKREIEINRENLNMEMALSLRAGRDREWSSPTLFKGKCEVKQNKNKI